jgi:hypothetical protein
VVARSTALTNCSTSCATKPRSCNLVYNHTHSTSTCNNRY